MSTPTPAPTANSPDGATPATAVPVPDNTTSSATASDRLVLEYLRSRGHKAAEQALLETLEAPSPKDKPSTPSTVAPDDFVKNLAVYAQNPARPGENALKASSTVLSELGAMNNPPNIQNLVSSLGPVGAEEILSLDPTDKQEGFRELEAWADGSLDMYRVSLNRRSSVYLLIPPLARISAHSLPHILSFLLRPHSVWVQRSRYVFYFGVVLLFL